MDKGQVIRLFRIANDLSMVELAKKSGVSKSYISEIEKGKKNCSLKILNTMMKVMDSDIDTFYQVKREIEEKGVKDDFIKSLEIVLNVYQ